MLKQHHLFLTPPVSVQQHESETPVITPYINVKRAQFPMNKNLSWKCVAKFNNTYIKNKCYSTGNITPELRKKLRKRYDNQLSTERHSQSNLPAG